MDRRRPAPAARPPVLLAAVLALALTACGGTAPESALGAAVGEWRLVEGTVPSGALVLVPAAADVTLVLDADPGASDGGVLAGGSSGCNQYATRFVPSPDGAIAVAEVAGTLMACLEPEVTALEAGYLEGLARITTLEVDGDRLVLSGPGVELRFARTAGGG